MVAVTPMHIVHCIARLNDGGPARVLLALGVALRARGHRITVLAGTPGPDEPDLAHRLREVGIVVELVPGLGRRMSVLDDARAFAWLFLRLGHLAPELVHTHTAKAGVLGRLACRWLGLPCLHTYHGHVLRGYFSRAGSLAVRMIERAVAGVHHNQALTPSQLVELRDRAGIGRRRHWHCLAVPVPPVVRSPAAWHARLARDVPVVGFLGRCVAVKDGDLWLAVLAAIARRRPVQGLMCGDGQLRQAWEARAVGLGLTVHFTSFVAAGEALAAMDLLLVTSRNEGQPLAVCEAGSAGVPVVAPPVGGLVDLIAAGAVRGAARRVAWLADACVALLDPAQLAERERLINVARVHAAGLAPESLVCRYEACYSRVLQRHAAPAVGDRTGLPR